jgi:protein-serine/threonine kinase
MLAGYLPFDDDPANPEGDNINLLYKYIVSTPLTFPEYVTPHARDLLKRILVPDPRKRADLFEVARHSWLSEYAHVVGFITSSTTTTNDIANTTVPGGKSCFSESVDVMGSYSDSAQEDTYEPPHLARSASVREPSKTHAPVAVIGGLAQKQGQIDLPDKQRSSRENKRRTVQVEYVAPQSSTVRGDASASAQAKTRARSESQGPVEVSAADAYQSAARASQRATSSAVPSSMSPEIRPGRDQPRSTSESVAQTGGATATRPSTGGSMSANSRLPSRGNSYGQPAIGVAKEQAQGRFSQPRGKQYTTVAGDGHAYQPPASNRNSAYLEEPARNDRSSFQSRGHKRSSTVGEFSEKLFGKRGSIFGIKTNSDQSKAEKAQKAPRSHPPVSMTKPIASDAQEPQEPRRSTDSRRTSFSFSRKNSTNPPDGNNRSSRRFSFIPASIAETFRGNRSSQQVPPPGSSDSNDQRNQSRVRSDSRPRMAFGRGESRSPSRSTTASTIPVLGDTTYDRPRESPNQRVRQSSAQTAPHNRYTSQNYPSQDPYGSSNSMPYSSQPYDNDDYYREPSEPVQHDRYQPQYPAGFNEYDQPESYPPQRKEKNVLQKPHRNFPGGYENDGSGSGGKAKRVMDFFRMRSGKARGGE